MKKFVAWALIFAMSFSLVACSGSNENMISSSGTLVISQSASSSSYPAEQPSAGQSLLISSSTPSSSSSSKASSSVSSSSASSKPASSSLATVSNLPNSSSSIPSSSSSAQSSQTVAAKSSREVRAVWISYLEFLNIAQNKTKAQFTSSIRDIFSTSSSYGLNTVLVQVRPFGDALYDSALFPWSYVLTGTEGEYPGYDPLAIMVTEAHKCGLKLEAWLNPYRIRAASTNKTLSSGTIARSYIGTNAVISFGGGYFYNPSNADARKLIIDGALEIIKNYDVDGINFDDYFYPTTDPAFDQSDYNSYKNSGGSLSLGDWRRNNVDILVRGMYNAIKAADKSVVFGISPQANMKNDYNSQFIDIEKWVTEGGYIDYICPQIYFGFENSTMPFASVVESWNNLVAGSNVDLLIGLAAYKCGVIDNNAGNGKTEWTQNRDMLSRMVNLSRKQSKYAGFVIYRYDSLFNPASSVKDLVASERTGLQALLG